MISALLLSPLSLAATDVSLQSADGVHLAGYLEAAEGATHGVVLVHMSGRSGADWSFLSARMARSGMTSLVVDLRGHGDSGGTADPLAMVQDVRAAVDHLQAQGMEQISCVGAELGANLCLSAAAEDAQITSVALLSPRLEIEGVKALPAMSAIAGRPTLVVSATDVSQGSRCAELLDRVSKGTTDALVVTDAGVGTRMLSRDPGLENQLMEWLMGSADLTSTAVGITRPMTDDNTIIETTGEKLPGHR